MMLTWIISSSVLLAGFLVLRHILTAAMSRRLQYALWAIVLLRLLLPFSFGETGFSVMNVPPVQMLTAGIDSSFDGITFPPRRRFLVLITGDMCGAALVQSPGLVGSRSISPGQRDCLR